MLEDKYPTDYPRDPHFSGVSHENATREPRAEVDDRGGVYRRDENRHDPRDNEGRYPEQAPEESPEDFTHYVHLANGDVIKHNLIDPLSTHFNPDDGDVTGGHKIIGVYPR
jgi:hypothetical protein